MLTVRTQAVGQKWPPPLLSDEHCHVREDLPTVLVGAMPRYVGCM